MSFQEYTGSLTVSPSNYSSIKWYAVADGYESDYTESNPNEQDLSNISDDITYSITMTQEESNYDVYIYLTASSPTTQYVQSSHNGYSGNGDPIYYFGSSSSEQEDDSTIFTITGSEYYYRITGLVKGDTVSGSITFSADGYTNSSKSFSVTAGESITLSSTLSVSAISVYLDSVYIDWTSSANTAIQTAYLNTFTINGTDILSSKPYQIFKADSVAFESESSNSGSTDVPSTTVSVASGENAKVEWDGYVRGYINDTTSTSKADFSGSTTEFTVSSANRALALIIEIDSGGTVSSYLQGIVSS